MKPTGCIRCGAAASHVLHPLELVACVDCYLLWIRDESLSVETLEAEGWKWRTPGQSYLQHSKRFDAELLRRTTEWAKKARAAA